MTDSPVALITGGEITPPKVETLEAMRAEIEQVVPRDELAAALAGSPTCPEACDHCVIRMP
jgi:hypothetical protein